MRRTTGLIALIAAAALAIGCSKKEEAPAKPADTQAAPVTPEVAKAQPAAEPPKADTPAMANNAGHCPSAAPGAETKIEEADGAVVVTVTGGSDESVAEIRKRAAHLSQVQNTPSDKVEHSGQGTGGGQLGICPVVTVDTTIAVEEVEKGAKITVKPNDAAKLAELKSTAEQRMQELTRQRFGATDKAPATDHEPGAGGGRGTGGGGGGGGSKGAGLNKDKDEAAE